MHAVLMLPQFDRAASTEECPRRCQGHAGALVAIDTLAGVCFCVAAGFGGYSTVRDLVIFGQVCWLAGSLLGFVRPMGYVASARQRRVKKANMVAIPEYSMPTGQSQ